MKKIQNYTAKANKERGDGTVEYCLWVDDCGNLYVQFVENVIDTQEPGSYTALLYPVSQYAHLWDSSSAIPQPTGYDTNSNGWKIGEGNNNPGFLKAVLRHLLA